MKPFDLAVASMLDVDDGHAVVVGIGDVQRFAVGRNAEGVGRAAFGRLRKQSGENRLLHGAELGVDHLHGVARGAGHEQPVVAGVQGQLVGMLADRNSGDRAQRFRIDDEHAPIGPVADVQQAIASFDDVVRTLTARRRHKLARFFRIDFRKGARRALLSVVLSPGRTTCCPLWAGWSANTASRI